ncbi:MAG: phospholipase D-like domain-containing protein [Bacteroidales bacterium]|jgi:phosphatidylserine/phosphatidylglycerophosphate/cardiolipin synthase-like enzyme|nr:phospholipase D-like domain-containing protein [Bacteroidales bacterium]MDD3329911.1 phospholipase D-like domain-containing protein [Bacteroidales bacterium]MDD3691158.1 phospholipase D-like domain-containing protein [Bacteroidales bacterium]MDD4044181.1 phospholipase D-like domain-containing protein [Bacteroidales bacterium]MDD4581324.1 phospholipase D-like domain-containing protein [Bacteroidales bacterium]
MSSPFITYISNEQHYQKVIQAVFDVKHDLWIGTADIKDVYVKQNNRVIPFVKVLADLIQKKVSIRLIHAKEPGSNFRNDFDKYPVLFGGLERVLCPRVHFKMLIFDMHTVYIGSANLTGAGLGMKSMTNRNFETGILTNEVAIVKQAIDQYDELWMGRYCPSCKRKDFCGDRLDK